MTRSKEELYGHDPELRRALDDLTAGKETDDPLYMAPPAICPPEPEFDGNRFQERTVPPGFLEFARTAVSPPLKLEKVLSKPEGSGQSVTAGLPVYAAPMVPPPANDPTLEHEPVRVSGDVKVELDPRRADTLRTIHAATRPVEGVADTAAAAVRSEARRTLLTRKVLGGVVAFAVGIFVLTLVVTRFSFRQERAAVLPQSSTSSALPLPSPPRASVPLMAESALKSVTPLSALKPVTRLKEPSTSVTPSSATRPTGAPRYEEASSSPRNLTPARTENRPSVPRVPPSHAQSPPPVRLEPAATPDNDIPLFDRKPTPRTPDAPTPTPG